MLHLRFAPSLDMLVSDLLKNVRKIWKDPFEAPDLLVPSPALGKWLSMRLADGVIRDSDGTPPFGCVANLTYRTIERYLWNLLHPGDTHMISQHDLQQVLCALLDEKCINQPAFEPVKRYLTDDSGIDPLKKVQLAGRIAHQFIEYEYNRPGVWRPSGAWNPPGIDGTWMQNRNYPGEAVSEAWQSELYRKARSCFTAKEKSTSGTDIQYMTLPQLYRFRREYGTPEDKQWNVSPRTIFIFGVAKVSHFHRNLIVEISQMNGIDTYVYLTNPCAEFWEDVDTFRTKKYHRKWSSSDKNAAIGPRKPDDYNQEELSKLTTWIPPEHDHKLLELWGHAGKENIFLWCQDAQWNFEYHCPEQADSEQEPVNVLEALQLSLLRRWNECPHPAGDKIKDESLQILACPDRGRELEEIREQILDMVHNGTVSMLNEIVVYLSDPTEYVPYIHRVFGRFAPYHSEYIPFCIISTSGKDTAFAHGIETLLKIIRNHFDRAHVFELLRNPIVQESRGIAPGDVAIWEHWTEELSIFRGYNREHRREMGDSGGTVTDAHTFEFGMARMLLADISAGPIDLHYREQNVSNGSDDEVTIPVIPYRDFSSSDRKKLELFCATVESLHRDCSEVREKTASGIENAVETLANCVNTWMGKIPDGGVVDPSAEGTMLRGFYESLWKLLLQRTCAERDFIPFEEFCALVSGCLPEEGAHHLSAWTGGITFAPLKPAMIVPQKVIFAAGLDDVLFPGSSESTSWDLLSHKRIIGDSDRVRDNRFAFLELIHAARKRLILSYRARDMQKEEELHPSSVILELEGFLCENGFTKPDAKGTPICSVSRTIPWIVHESLNTFADTGRVHGSWNRNELELEQIARCTPKERKTHRYELSAPSVSDHSDIITSLHTTLFDLKEFFKNPVVYHLKRTLGIELEETPTTLSATDEPLDSGSFALSILQNEVWTAVLRKIFPENESQSIDNIDTLNIFAGEELAHRYNEHIATGHAPEAMMECMERDMLSGWLYPCVEVALSLKEKFFPCHYLMEKTDLSLGREGIAGTLQVPLGNGHRCTVECRHNLVLVPRTDAENVSVGIIAFKTEGKAADNPDLWLEGILQWYTGIKHDQNLPLLLVQLNRGEGKKKPVKCSTVPMIEENGSDPDEWDSYFNEACEDEANQDSNSKPWLPDLIDQMLVANCSEYLPFEAIKKFWPDPTIKAISDNLASDRPVYRSFYPALKLIEPVLPDFNDAQLKMLAHRRYAPMLEAWFIDREKAT